VGARCAARRDAGRDSEYDEHIKYIGYVDGAEDDESW
jgi:hypothetical protein